jgi:hypothetical protein
MKYTIQPRIGGKFQPHLSDLELNEILVRDFNKYTFGRWRKEFLPACLTVWDGGCLLFDFNAPALGISPAADTAITVQERVDSFELDMGKAGLDEQRQARGVLVHEAFELVRTGVQFRDRRGHRIRK